MAAAVMAVTLVGWLACCSLDALLGRNAFRDVELGRLWLAEADRANALRLRPSISCGQ